MLFAGLAAFGTADAICASSADFAERAATRDSATDPYPSTYRPLPSRTTLIVGATILTGEGRRIDEGMILMMDGRVAGVGKNIEAPPASRIIDANGKWITPGLIDVHSHIGVGYGAMSRIPAHVDNNEMTSPNAAGLWIEHSVWPQDPAFIRALAGGVTTIQILPGSANLFGGRGITLKNVPSISVQDMKFPGAPYGLKMACGENPKKVYGEGKAEAPATRMGNFAGYRAAWIQAVSYKQKWDAYRAAPGDADAARTTTPERDLELETLVGALTGDILVHVHCYEASEMVNMIDLSREFGFKVAAFHHATEAYKIAPRLSGADICTAMWADWWGFKMEAFDAIPENIAMVDQAGGCAILHSDSPVGIQHLNQEAAKAMSAGRRAGFDISEEQAIRWLTFNPATSLGVGEEVGSLEPGKAADVVVWTAEPFSVYSLAELVFIDGALVYERGNPELDPASDFELGLVPQGGVR